MTEHNPSTRVAEISFDEWPNGLTLAVTAATRALAAAEPGDTVLLSVPSPPEDPGYREGAREALRSVIHASTLERPKLRANLIFGGNRDDHTESVHYLSGATFVFGATVDLGVNA